jgi:small subunit ribosomal protein S7
MLKKGRMRRDEVEEKKVVPALPEHQRVTGRRLRPDPRFGSLLAGKFINCMMEQGRKSAAQRIFYDAMEIIKEKSGGDPLDVFTKALENIKPLVEVRSKRVGGATYQVPCEVSKKRALSLAIRWLLEATRSKKGSPMANRLAAELLDANKKEGAAVTKRENTHKMAEANKAFAHYAW